MSHQSRVLLRDDSHLAATIECCSGKTVTTSLIEIHNSGAGGEGRRGSTLAMSDQAESSRRSPPMTPPRSPTNPQDSNSEAILWAASEDDSSSTAHTDLLSLWLSNYTGLPEFEAKEEPVADVPTLLDFDLESSFLDLGDWNTTNTAFKQAPVVTEPLWVQLQAPATSEVDDISRLALRIQSPKASILPLAPRIQDPEACVAPPALGIQSPPASSEIVVPQASLLPLELGLQFPPASFGVPPPQAPISPLVIGTDSSIIPMTRGIEFPEASISLALGIQSPQISSRSQSAPSSFSSLSPIPSCTLPMAPPLWNLISTIPCTLSMAPPLWNLPPISCPLPVAPPLWNFLPSSSPAPERRSWSEFQSPPPPARGQFLLPDPPTASGSMSSPFIPPSHQLHHFFPAANTGNQQQVSVGHAPVTFCTRNATATASFSTKFVPGSRPSWSPAMAPRGSWTPHEPWISSSQDTRGPIPRRPRFLLPPPTAETTMPAPLSLSLPIANFGSSARRDVQPGGDHQRVQVQTGESSRPRKRSKRALELSGSEALQWDHDGVEVAPIAREAFVMEPALNRNGKARALPGTATDSQSLYARYKREKVKQRVKILQRLVPNGDKADLAILLEQVYIYIKFLEQKIKILKSNVDWKLDDLSHILQ